MDLTHFESWIGREETACETISPRLASQFAATLDLPGNWETGTKVPQMIHWCLAQGAAPSAGLAPDGHLPRGSFLPPVPLPRRMWAGGAVQFHHPLRVGDTVTRRSTIANVALKEGRSGPLCFVTVEHVFCCADREVVSERQEIVYRAASAEKPGETTSAVKAAPQPADSGQQSQIVSPTPQLLFRYSAVTFNAHRIHYDTEYARQTEGYPGLVVHGPLQATLLCQYAGALRGKPVRAFNFRSVSPVFDTADFTINATADEDEMQLWTAQTGGPVAMQASASW